MSNNTDDLFKQALLAYNRKDYAEAETTFMQIISTAPFSSEAHLNLGNVYFKQGRLPDAEAMWQKTMQINPVEEKAYLNLGNLYFSDQKFEKAIYYWEIFQRLEPAHANIHLNLGMAYERLRRLPEAFRCYNMYIKARGVGPESEQLKQKIEEAKTVGEHNLKQAEILMRNGKLKQAKRAFEMSLSLIPVHPKLYKHYGAVLYQLGDWTEASIWYEKAARQINDDPGLLINLGVLFDHQGRLFETMWAFELAIRMSPQTSDKVKKRFDILWTDYGRDLIDQTLTEVQSHIENSQFDRAECLAQRLFDFTFVKAPAKLPPIRNVLESLEERRNPKKLAAKQTFQLAEEHRKNGQNDMALRHYERYLNLMPEGDQAAYCRNMVKSLEAGPSERLMLEDKSAAAVNVA